jgi:ribonuclease-3
VGADDLASLAPLEAQTGGPFHNVDLLRTALTHPSYANEHPAQGGATNERLEFLGDAVLGLVVAQALYARFPEVQEGRLTEWRAQLVQGPTLARVAADMLDLGRWLRLGHGEELTGGREREGNLGRAFEAIIGALYLDSGLEAARAFVERMLADEMAAIGQDDPARLNPKGILQQTAQDGFGRPAYVVLDAAGPEHDRRFHVEVRILGEPMGEGRGTTKQEAEKAAAFEALTRLRARIAADAGRGIAADADGGIAADASDADIETNAGRGNPADAGRGA